jgi:energy-coupling factor transport system ATP-binding protein
MALAGLWPAAEGEVRLRGIPFAPGAAASRREVAVVFQDPSSQLLQPTVRDELAFAARNLDQPGERIDRAIARLALELGLSGDLDRDPRALSAGRQQLVLLAAALVPQPALLIADEPGAHLDPDARARVLAVVRDRVRAGLAVVWVTQDQAERAAADRELVLGPPEPRPQAPGPGVPNRNGAPTLLEVRVGPPPPDGPAVRLAGLSDLTIPVRGVLAVVGPNGSGKSVLLGAIAGLLETDQVRIRWRRSMERPPIIATQYPEMQIFEERVGAEIEHAAVQRGRARPEVQRTLLQCLEGMVTDPAGFLGRRCWTLSSGEKRLVGILGALLAPAPLVLLDEPTAGLDTRLRAAVGRLVAARSNEVPVVVATQDREWAESLGAAVHGSPASTCNTPSHRQKTD